MSSALPRWLAPLPNLVSLARAGLAVPICLLLIEASPRSIWLALGLFALAAATDYLDGALAGMLRARSTLGSHLDPLADKLLVGAPLAVIPFTQNAFMAPTSVAFVLFCAAELPKAWRRIKLLRRGRALHASTSAKWKTLAEYTGIAAIIVGLASVPWREAWQVAGSAAIMLACSYAWRTRKKI